MRLIPRRLGPKLNLSLVAFMLVLLVATTGLLLFGFHRTQDNATRRSREGLEAQGRDSLYSMTRTQAFIGQDELRGSAELTQHAARYFQRLTPGSTGDGAGEAARLVRAPSGELYDASAGRTSDLGVPVNVPVDDAVRRDLRDSATFDALFPALLGGTLRAPTEANFDAIAMYYIGPSGVSRFYPPAGTGDRFPAGFQPQQMEAYLRARPEANPGRGTVWTPPHRDASGLVMTVSAATPIYVGGEFRGVVAVDLSLARLTDQVNQVRPTASGFAFYVDSTGGLLQSNAFDVVGAAVADASNTAFARTFQAMRDGRSGVDRVTLGGREVFVAYAPMEGVGGNFAMVAPISEITQQAASVASAIHSEGNRTVTFVLAVMAVAFAGAVAGAAWLNRRVLLQPIDSLVAGTRAVAAGNLDATIPVGADDELGALAESFNRMTAEIRARTTALGERETQYQSIFESTTDGMTITTLSGRLVEANPAMCEMHGYTHDEFMALAPGAYVDPGYRSLRQLYFEHIRRGQRYRLRARDLRKDGSAFDVDVMGSPFLYRGEPHILGVVRDVTEEVHAHHLLEQRVQERTKALGTLIQVGQTVASTLELEPLLGVIVDELKLVIDYGSISIHTLRGDGSELTTVARRGPGPASVGRRLPAVGPTWDAMKRGMVINIGDVRGESYDARAYRETTGDRLDSEFAHVRSFLGVPLKGRDRVIGFLSMSKPEPDFFTREHVDLATAFANYAAAAIENARLFAEAGRRAKEMEGIARVASALTFDRPMQETLNLLARDIVEATRASACSLLVVDQPGELPRLVGDAGLPKGYFEAIAATWREGFRTGALEAFDQETTVVSVNTREVILSDDRYQRIRGFWEASRWQATVMVPMEFGGRPTGVLNVIYDADAVPDRQEVRLLEAIASHAAVALENARLFAESERRAHEMEALSKIASTLAFDQPFGSTLNALAERIVEATTAVACSVTLFDEQGAMELAGTAGLFPPGMVKAVTEAFRRGAESGTTSAFQSRRQRIARDVRALILADPQWGPLHRLVPEIVWDTMVSVPMTYRGVTVGTVDACYLPEVEPGVDELSLLGAIADQSAAAVENARLFRELGRRADEMEALYRADESLHRSLRLDEVLRALVDSADAILRPDKISLLTWDTEHRRLQVVEARGFKDATREAMTTTEGLAGRAAEGEMVVVEDVDTEPHVARAVTDAEGIRSFMHAPIRVSGEVFGVFSVSYVRRKQFSEAEKRVFRLLGQRAAVAIDNARLFGRAQQAASLEERQRLARELHDSVSQALFGISLGAQTARTLLDREPEKAAEPLDYVVSLADAGLAELRALIFELRPEKLESEGLVQAIRQQVAALEARYALSVEADLCEEPPLSLELKETLYRISQEAMHNIVKHARAQRVELRLACHGNGAVTLEINDDGIGFNAAGEFPGHLGLRSMRERAAGAGAVLSIESAPGEGTRLTLEVPPLA